MKLPVFFTLIGLSILVACDSDDDQATPLSANAGKDQLVSAHDTVQLDGSASTGPEGFQYQWEYQGYFTPEEIQLSETNTPTPSFIPPQNGLYPFELKTFINGDTSISNTLVTASGAIEIGGILQSNLELTNIETNPMLPDYTVSSTLIIPDGLTLAVKENDVVIVFSEDAGLVVNSGGTFTNYDTLKPETYLQNTRLTSIDGWKGILIDGGTISLRGAYIEKAGKTPISEDFERAALTFADSSSSILYFEENAFISSYLVDMLSASNVRADMVIDYNLFSAPIPYKGPMSFHTIFKENNQYPQEYQYVHLTGGMDTKHQNDRHRSYYFYNTRYYIEGGLWTDSDIFLYPEAQILMQEGTGFIVERGFSTAGSTSSWIKGKDEAKWLGFGITGNNSSFRISNITVEGAGNGLFDHSTLKSKEEAVVYNNSSKSISIRNCTINGSNGYGYYQANLNDFTTNTIENNVFAQTARAAIRTTSDLFNRSITTGHGNTFDMPTGVPAILIQEGSGGFRRTWPYIGENFYEIDVDLRSTGSSLTIEPGVHFKMAKNRYIKWHPLDQVPWKAEGTSDRPIIFEGLEQSPGYWGGIYIFGRAHFDHVMVKDAGGKILEDASAEGNIVFRGSWGPPFQTTITNSTIANSAAHGAIYEFGYDPGLTDPSNNLTFSNNVLFDVYDAENDEGTDLE